MILTEQEAKSKWCPHARCAPVDINVGGDATWNRLWGADSLTGPETMCIASACMAWRWVRTHVDNPAGGDLIPDSRTYGFCGAFGIPAGWEDAASRALKAEGRTNG